MPGNPCAVCGAAREKWPGNWNVGRARWCPKCAPAAKKVREWLRRRGFVEISIRGDDWRRAGNYLRERTGALVSDAEFRKLVELARADVVPKAHGLYWAAWHEDAHRVVNAADAAVAEVAAKHPSRAARARGSRPRT